MPLTDNVRIVLLIFQLFIYIADLIRAFMSFHARVFAVVFVLTTNNSNLHLVKEL